MSRKAPGPKTSDKRRRTVLTKRRYKVRVIVQPIPTTQTPTAPLNSAAPTTTVATPPTQTPLVMSVAESILVMVYKLAKGKFDEVPYPTGRPQNEGHPPIQSSNPPPLEEIPNAPVRHGTPWPSTGSASENLFDTRKDWLIPPTPAPTLALIVKMQAPCQVAVIPHAMVTPKQVAEKCSWGLHCPICKKEEEHEEDWDAKGKKNNQEYAHKTLSTPSHKTFSTSTHKTLSIPSHLVSLTDTLNKSDWEDSGKKR